MLSLSMRRRVLPAFLGLELILWLTFLWLDTAYPTSSTLSLKYFSVLLCALIALLALPHGGDRFVAAAMVLTACGDALLGFCHLPVLGFLLFYAAQTLYMMRICLVNGGRAFLSLRAGLFLLLLLGLIQLGLFTPVSASAALFFCHLIFNTVQSTALHTTQQRVFSLGLILLLGYVLCAILCHAPGLFSSALVRSAGAAMWSFYLPSQVLITLSALIPPQR